MCEVDESDHSSDDFAKFFVALKVAVNSVDEIKSLGAFNINPLPGISLKECLNFPNVAVPWLKRF